MRQERLSHPGRGFVEITLLALVSAFSLAHLLLCLRRCSRFRLKRPSNGRLTNAIDFGQLCHCLALGVAISSSADHFLIQFALATERDALGLGPLDAFLAALADQVTLELGYAAHDGQHEPAVACGGVAPAFPKR